MEVRALLDLGDVAKATRKLDDLASRVGWRGRLAWFRAVSEMLTADDESATKHFTEVLDTMPGELAPKLALAATAELAGSADERKFYNTVWSTDNGAISAGSVWPVPSRPEATATAPSARWTKCQPPQGISPRRGSPAR